MEKRALVQPNHALSLRRQCGLLGLHRSNWYYEPEPVSAEEFALMRTIDKLSTSHPFFGSRNITTYLRRAGRVINRKRVQRLMRIMGLEGMVPGPHTSRPHPEHKVYPYLLRGKTVTRPNEVWAADITFIPLEFGWAYLVAIIDWRSRAVLAWRLSNSMTVDFCLDALTEALRRHGRPEIFNTDQGAQFTAADFTDVLKANDVAISMDGKGRAIDNVFVERLWRTVKYEDIYLKAYASLDEARAGLTRYFRFYNSERPHQSLGNHTPIEVYRGKEVVRKAA
jgi:putative transposase